MGVQALAVADTFQANSELLDEVRLPPGAIVGESAAACYAIRNDRDDDFIVLNELRKASVPVELSTESIRVGPQPDQELWPPGALVFEAADRAKEVLERVLPDVSTSVASMPTRLPAGARRPLPRCRIGVYQPWVPSTDEGWTRFVLERYRFPYTTLHDAEVRSGNLNQRIDSLLIPSITAERLREGYRPNETEPAYVGGLGNEGVHAIREFVSRGGNLVCLEDSCTFALETFHLRVPNILKGLPTSTFYGPGSILRIEMIRASDGSRVSRLTGGMPDEAFAFFDRSLAFDVETGSQASDAPAPVVAVRYASHHVLESGWLHGAEKIEGKAAVVDCAVGTGRVVLIGFPAQHRGQTQGTFRLLFNALLRVSP
jgi:hypothetical protein